VNRDHLAVGEKVAGALEAGQRVAARGPGETERLEGLLAQGPGRVRGHRGDRAALAVVETSPQLSELVGDLVVHGLDGGDEARLVGGFTRIGVLPEVVGDQHGTLWVSGGEVEQEVERLVHFPAGLGEASAQVVSEIIDPERCELHGAGLSVEGPLSILE